MAFPLLSLIPAVTALIEKLVPDPEARNKLNKDIGELLQGWDKAQLAVNAVEAGHRNIWVAGWRPFIGWTCGVAFAWHYVLMPITILYMVHSGVDIVLPEFDMTHLMTVLGGILGLGGMRSWEKFKGLTS